jgi:hypothetical protein
MSQDDDMMSCMEREGPSALERYIEEAKQDDFVERLIERIRERNQRIRRLYGLPERDYPPIERFLEEPSLD